jgi:hypothetical protein
MRQYFFLLAAVLMLAIAFPSRAAEKPQTVQVNNTPAKKVWTNEDMDEIRARGLISIVGPDANQTRTSAATAAVSATAAPAFPVYSSRLDNPAWYAQKAADLQAELDMREAAWREQQTAMAQAADRITQPGIAMDKGNAGVTPEAGLAILEAQVQEVQNELNELGDLAHQHDIPPGALRD